MGYKLIQQIEQYFTKSGPANNKCDKYLMLKNIKIFLKKNIYR